MIRHALSARLMAAASVAALLMLPTTALASAKGFENVLKLNAHDRVLLQEQINGQLKAGPPGGIQISQYEVSWDDGAAVIALPAPGRKGAPPASLAARKSTDTVNLRAGAQAAKGATPSAKDIVVQPNGTSNSCPYSLSGTDWYCWYTDWNFDGARFQFSYNYCPGSPNGPQINFASYGRDNQATSWVNNTDYAIHVWDLANAGGTQLWVEVGVSNSRNVGATNNDRASSFRTCYR